MIVVRPFCPVSGVNGSQIPRREPTGGRRKMLMREKVGIMRTIIGGLL